MFSPNCHDMVVLGTTSTRRFDAEQHPFINVSSNEDILDLSLFDDIGTIMQIRTPLDLGLAIHDRRRKLKLSQTELARKAGVGRQWVVAIEHGKSRAELGLVLRTLSALDLPLTIDPGDRRLPSSDGMNPVDIDAVVNATKEAPP